MSPIDLLRKNKALCFQKKRNLQFLSTFLWKIRKKAFFILEYFPPKKRHKKSTLTKLEKMCSLCLHYFAHLLLISSSLTRFYSSYSINSFWCIIYLPVFKKLRRRYQRSFIKWIILYFVAAETDAINSPGKSVKGNVLPVTRSWSDFISLQPCIT